MGCASSREDGGAHDEVDYLPGVSVCAAGTIGRDFYVIAEGAVSMYIDEELFCAKSPGDCIAMSARYPTEGGSALSGGPPEGAERPAKLRPASNRNNAASGGAGYGKCIAVSTASTRLVHLTREAWSAFQRDNVLLCERIYPLLVEPSATLAHLNFFRGIHARMLQNIGLMFRVRFLRQGEILFEELAEGNSLFIVSSGVCEAFVGSAADGSEKILKEFHRHDILGEIAVMMAVPRTASVRATSDCFLLELQKDNFKKFVRLAPATSNIHSIMKSRTAEHFRKYKVPFFSSIPEEKYLTLAELCVIEQFPAGSVIFREGDPARCFYIIAHGELVVTVKGKPKDANGAASSSSSSDASAVEQDVPQTRNARGSIVGRGANPSPGRKSIVAGDAGAGAPMLNASGERELTRMGPGRYFGEIALVQDSFRTATVTALTRSVVLSITKENFHKFFEEAPESVADFEVKLARYDVRLKSVLYHPVGISFFLEHLKREYCLQINELVRMADGSTKEARLVRVGDMLAGESGVVRVTQALQDGEEPPASKSLYRITHTDGSSYVVTGAHRVTCVSMVAPYLTQLKSDCSNLDSFSVIDSETLTLRKIQACTYHVSDENDDNSHDEKMTKDAYRARCAAAAEKDSTSRALQLDDLIEVTAEQLAARFSELCAGGSESLIQNQRILGGFRVLPPGAVMLGKGNPAVLEFESIEPLADDDPLERRHAPIEVDGNHRFQLAGGILTHNSTENLEFWRACRDYRHLSFADIPPSKGELEAVAAEMDQEIAQEMAKRRQLQLPARTDSPASGAASEAKDEFSSLSPRARRQSLARIHNNDIATAFDLFVDPSAGVPATAASRPGGGEQVMSLDSLVEMLRFFQIPLPPSDDEQQATLLEMAQQLGYELPPSQRAFISRAAFIRVLCNMEQGIFAESARKAGVNSTLEQMQAQQAQEQSARVDEWAPGKKHTRDPTSDYLPPDLAALSAPVEASSSPRSLSLASKLLLKLTRLILDIRVAKLKSTFEQFDFDKSGSIELNEFEAVCAALSMAAPSTDGGDTASIFSSSDRISALFKGVDVDGSGSISLLEFVHFILVEKKSARALQALLDARAREIYDTYISNRAPKQVNIRGPAQKRLQLIMDEGAPDVHKEAATPRSANHLVAIPCATPTSASHAHRASAKDEETLKASFASGSRPRITQSMFDEAEDEIMALMGADSFSRFKQSDLFQQFLVAAGAYNFQGHASAGSPEADKAKAAQQQEAASAASADGPAPAFTRGHAGSTSLPSPMKTQHAKTASAAAALSAGKPKLRSGSVLLAPRAGVLLDSIDALADDQRLQATVRSELASHTHTPAPDAEDDNSDAEDFPVSAGRPLEVEVVQLEQLGIDALTHPHAGVLGSSAGAPTRMGPNGRPYAGRSSVFFTQHSTPVGLATFRTQQAEKPRTHVTQDMFAPPSEEEETRAAAASDAATRSPAPLDTGTPPSESHDDDAAVADGVPASSSVHTPVRAVAATSPASSASLVAAGHSKNPLQSPAAPRGMSLAGAALDKNPLQSPVAGRRAAASLPTALFDLALAPVPSDGDLATPDSVRSTGSPVPLPPLHSLNDADLLKDPLQSPAPNRRRSAQQQQAQGSGEVLITRIHFEPDSPK